MILACAAEVRREDPGQSDGAGKTASCQARVGKALAIELSFVSVPDRTR